MKNLIARTLTLLMLAVLGLTMASAQTTSVIKVNVPFEFSFADRTFPAGEYSLIQPMQHLLVLRDARGYSIAQSFTGGIESLSAADATKLKFVNQDGQYVLTEVWESLDSSGQRLYPSRNNSNLVRRSTEARAAAEGSQLGHCSRGDPRGAAGTEPTRAPAGHPHETNRYRQTETGLPGGSVRGRSLNTRSIESSGPRRAPQTARFYALVPAHPCGSRDAFGIASGHAGTGTKVPTSGRASQGSTCICDDCL